MCNICRMQPLVFLSYVWLSIPSQCSSYYIAMHLRRVQRDLCVLQWVGKTRLRIPFTGSWNERVKTNCVLSALESFWVLPDGAALDDIYLVHFQFIFPLPHCTLTLNPPRYVSKEVRRAPLHLDDPTMYTWCKQYPLHWWCAYQVLYKSTSSSDGIWRAGWRLKGQPTSH